MQALFQLDIQGSDEETHADEFLNESQADPDVVAHARGLVHDTWSRRKQLDAWISASSKHWDLARIAPVERSILRLALVEMLVREDPPMKVAINEAIELSKEFGTAESPQFINGLLDAIRKQQESASESSTESSDTPPPKPENTN